MKLIALAAFLLPAAIAVPVDHGDGLVKRDVAVTNELVFTVSYDAFLQRYIARNPPHLDWESKYCPGPDGILPGVNVNHPARCSPPPPFPVYIPKRILKKGGPE